MRPSKLTLACVATIAFLALPSAAKADAAGDKVLATIDAALNKHKTLRFEYEATIAETGKSDAKLALIVLDKGEHHLFEFTAPADMKGTKALVLSATDAYVYLPAFGKVRRIASLTADRFLGLTFSLEDLTRTRYGDQ